jgi:two-component system response regulator PilR (NtrC family)
MTARPTISILVAEDEEELRTLIESTLRGEGYAVSVAQDGAVAISLIGMNSFDVALLDIHMPHASGLDVLRHLHDRSPATKVIMLTGFGDLKNAMEAREFGAVDFINKPCRVEEVVATIARVLENPRQ